MDAFLHAGYYNTINESSEIIKFFNQKYYLSALIAYLLLFIEAILINNLCYNHKLINKASLLPGLLFIIFSSYHPSTLFINSALISSLFVILTIEGLFSIYGEEQKYAKVFNIGFYASIAGLLYKPALLLIVFIFISLVVFKIFNFRVWVIYITGFIIPLLFSFTYYFYTEQFIIKINDYIHIYSLKSFVLKGFNLYFKLFAIPVIFIFFLSIISIFGRNRDKQLKVRRIYLALFWLVLVLLSQLFYNSLITEAYLCLIFIPLSIVCSNYLIFLRKNIHSEILLYTLIIAILSIKICFLIII